MSNFLLMFAYGLLVIGSWVGWGICISRLLGSGDKDNAYKADAVSMAGYLRSIGVGLSFMVIVGGILNIFGVISSTLIYVLVAIGIALAIISVAFDFRRLTKKARNSDGRSPRSGFGFAAVMVALILLAFFKYSSAISPGAFNPHDDFQGYFVFPQKMIETGSMGNDPMSERRILSLGGKAFIDTFVLAAGDIRNLHFADRGIGFLAFMLVLLGVLRGLGIRRGYIALTLFIPLLVPAPMANITAIYLASALFASLIYALYRPRKGFGQLIIVALIAAGLCALKSSFVPVAALFVIAHLLMRNWHDERDMDNRSAPKKTLKSMALEGMAVSAMIVVLMLPWLIASYQSNGTLLYPLLGKGFHGSAYGTFLTATSQVGLTNIIDFAYDLTMLLLAACILLVIALGTFKPWKMARAYIRKEDIALINVTALGIIGLGLATAGLDVPRYTFAFVIAAVTIMLARYLDGSHAYTQTDAKPEFGSGRFAACMAPMIICGMLIGAGAQTFMKKGKRYLSFLSFAASGTTVDSVEESVRYRALQESVPAGETMIVRLSKNHLFDFKRNTIYIADYPGGSSLPPSMPFFRGPEALASYLIDKGIFYLAYSYRDQAAFTKEKYGYRLAPTMNAWIRTEAEHTLDFQDNVSALGQSRKRLYDDGIDFVIDLRDMAN